MTALRFPGRFAFGVIAAVSVLLLVRDASAVDATGVSSNLTETASTSPEQKKDYAESAVQEIDAAVKAMEKLLEQLTEKKDTTTDAVNCATAKLTSIRALQAVAVSSQSTMVQALADGNDESANHEYRKIAVAVSKTRSQLAEGQKCASDTKLESGTTLVDWETALDDSDDDLVPDIDDFDLDPQPPSITPFS